MIRNQLYNISAELLEHVANSLKKRRWAGIEFWLFALAAIKDFSCWMNSHQICFTLKFCPNVLICLQKRFILQFLPSHLAIFDATFILVLKYTSSAISPSAEIVVLLVCNICTMLAKVSAKQCWPVSCSQCRPIGNTRPENNCPWENDSNASTVDSGALFRKYISHEPARKIFNV